MSDFERLKLININKIYEDTRISKKNIEFILNGDYTADKHLHIVHFDGFLKILEDTYNMDLSDIREQYKSIYDNRIPNQEQSNGDYSNNKEKKHINPIFFVIGFIIIITLVYIFFIRKDTTKTESQITPVETAVNQTHEEVNTSDEGNTINDTTNMTTSSVNMNGSVNVTANESIPDDAVSDSTINYDKVNSNVSTTEVTITPHAHTHIWIGIINLDNGTKTDITITKKYVVDLKNMKKAIIKIGSANVDISFNGNVSSYYMKSQVIHFKYENHKLIKIRKAEFIKLNGGVKW